MGAPVDALFSDREVFADFFTRYYTDWEPESAMVVDAEGEVVGYLNGCVRPRRYGFVQAWIIAAHIIPRVIARTVALDYSRRDCRFLWWVLARGRAETPRTADGAAHFHFNLLPAWRNGEASRRLFYAFIEQLRQKGVRRVFAQIQTYRDSRPLKLFERFGFKLHDRRRVTRFESLARKEVYVCTITRDLAA